MRTVYEISFSGGVKSISDDDLCSDCVWCTYNPGDMSGCQKDFPGKEDEDGYVVSCSEFHEINLG